MAVLLQTTGFSTLFKISSLGPGTVCLVDLGAFDEPVASTVGRQMDASMYASYNNMATSRADVLTSGRTTSPLVSASGSHEAHKSSQPRVRRRNRVINSCLECRRRKLKCDKEAPCTNCARFKRDCLYLAPSQEHGQRKLAQIKDQMGALEKILEREVANQQTKARDHGANGIKLSMVSVTHPESEEENDAGAQDEEGLEPTALAALDIVYEDNPDDELIDLGVQMGKMRITERVGGWVCLGLCSYKFGLYTNAVDSSRYDRSSPTS